MKTYKLECLGGSDKVVKLAGIFVVTNIFVSQRGFINVGSITILDPDSRI